MLKNVSAKNLSTYKGGGKIKSIMLPETAAELCDAVLHSRLSGIEPYLLGGGSNTIISDGEINRTVISTRRLNDIEVENEFVICGAGASLGRIIQVGRTFGLGGLEFLGGVPATVGGALSMNAGAYSAEISDYADEIYVLTPECEICTLSSSSIAWGHRKGVCGIIAGAKLRLVKMDLDASALRMKECLNRRKLSQPRLPSVGSVFKKADKPAGYYVDNAGLKGTKKGGAEISRLHANFIVNTGDGTAEDFLYLATLAEKRVFEQFGVRLEREFKLLAE